MTVSLFDAKGHKLGHAEVPDGELPGVVIVADLNAPGTRNFGIHLAFVPGADGAYFATNHVTINDYRPVGA
jgi:hypothetical protein